MSKTTKPKANKLLNNLLKKPKKDTGVNMPKFIIEGPNISQQADLLFLPNDDGFKYALVVTDLYNSKTDSEPLKNKESTAIKNGFETIYKRGILKMPQVITTDSGSEFKGVVKQYFKNNKVYQRTALPGRHRQVGMVEKSNFKIGYALHKRMTGEELITGTPSREWTDDLPKVVSKINKKAHPRFSNLQDKPLCAGDSCKLLNVGDKVRVILNEPRAADESFKKLHGKFRASDIRWDPIIETIENVSLIPNQPPLYIVSNHKHVMYTKNQLQVVKPNEQLPKTDKYVKGKHEVYKIEKILSKQKIKGVMKLEVKWVGYKEPTWETYSKIKEDVPDMVAAFEKSQKTK